MAATSSQLSGRLWRYLPVIAWMGVIFFLSTSQGSMSKTSFIVRPVLEFLFPTADDATLTSYQFIVRKLAHLTEYGILAFLAARAFVRSSKIGLSRWWFLVALLLVLLVASTDEFNQSFDPLRTATPVDVLIDLAGGTVGATLYFVIRYFVSRRLAEAQQ